MDSEFKKLLAGDTWAQDGDRVDMDDTSIQPVINRDEGFGPDFSTNKTPSRARINQILRELSGAAKEVVYGVSIYDAQVRYPVGSLTQVSGDVYYALQEHDPGNPVNPLDDTSNPPTHWKQLFGRTADERTVPDQVPSNNIFIDNTKANQIRVWWNTPDNGGFDIEHNQLQYSKNDTFTSGETTINDYVQGTPIGISGRDSDLYYVRVRNQNSAGWSAWSPGVRVRSTPLAPESVNSLIVQPSGTSGSVWVSFAKPVDNGLNITGYKLQWKSGAQSYSESERIQDLTTDYPGEFSYTLTGLSPPDITYTFRVQAISNRGTRSSGGLESASSAVGSVQVPARPVVETEAINATTMRAWITVPFSTGGVILTGHQWRYRKATTPASTWTTTNQTADASIVLENLDRGASYEFEVRAINGNGEGQWSLTKSQPPYTPDKPQSPVISVGTNEVFSPGEVKGEVKFSLGDMTKPEVVKDRIIQTAVRWRQTGTGNFENEESSQITSAENANRFDIPQIFPASGNIPLAQNLDVQARWRNAGAWSDWSPIKNLAAVSAPSGNLVLSRTGSIAVKEGQSTTVTVKLSRAPVGTATVNITSSNNILTVSPSTLSFNLDNWNIERTVTLTAGTDADEIDDAANVTFATSGGITAGTDTLRVRVVEPLRLTVNPSQRIYIPKGQVGHFYLSVNASPDQPVVVSYTPSDSTNFTLSGSSFTFNATNWKVTRSLNILTTSQTATGNYTINISATGGITTTDTIDITVTDASTSSIDIFAGGAITRIGRGQTLTNTKQVRVSAAPSAAFVADVISTNPFVTATPSTLTYELNNWNVYQNITIEADDNAPVNAFARILIVPRTDVGVLQDDFVVNVTEPLLVAEDFFIPEGSFVQTTIRLSSGTTDTDVTIEPSSTLSGIDFQDSSGNDVTSWTIARNTSSVNIIIASDRDTDLVENTGTITFTPSGGGYNLPVTVNASIKEPNNGLGMGNSGEDNDDSFETTISAPRGALSRSRYFRLLTPAKENVTISFLYGEPSNFRDILSSWPFGGSIQEGQKVDSDVEYIQRAVGALGTTVRLHYRVTRSPENTTPLDHIPITTITITD